MVVSPLRVSSHPGGVSVVIGQTFAYSTKSREMSMET